MSTKITICGASDDLIEIDGDIREEIYAIDEKPTHLAFSEGTVLSIQYDDDGCWRIHQIKKGSAFIQKAEAEGPDSDNYSDVVTLTGDISWICAGELISKSKI